MTDPSYQLDPNHPANKGKYPAESARADEHRDEVLSKDTITTAYRGRVAGPRAAPQQPEPVRPQTETERLFPDRDRIAEVRQAHEQAKRLGLLPR